MTNTSIENAAQATAQGEAGPQTAVAREAEEILGRAELAIGLVDSGIDDLKSAIFELELLATELPDEAETEVEFAAGELGDEATKLFNALAFHFAELRKWVVAAVAAS